MATTRNCTRPPAPDALPAKAPTPNPQPPTRYTFAQVRAHLANAAHHHFTESELRERLRAVGVEELPSTRRALAMRYAWVLLPGGVRRAKGGRS